MSAGILKKKQPFLEDIKKGKNSVPLSPEAAQEYSKIVLIECMDDEGISMEELRASNIHVLEILLKRIEVLKLPISFTPEALIAALVFTESNPGKLMVLLIDCLTEFEGARVNATMLADIYPYGFYNQKTLENYIDNYLKKTEEKSKIKWGNIY